MKIENEGVATLTLALAALVGCGGSREGQSADGGDGSAQAETAPQGMLSFDVTATLAPGLDAGLPGKDLPPTDSFTLVLDVERSRIIVGGKGRAAVVPVQRTGAGGFATTGTFSVGVAGTTCSGLASTDYHSLTFTVGAAGLTGHAEGAAQVSCGDCFFSEGFIAEIVGKPDVTPPVLLTGLGPPLDPFAPFSVVASEPLPTTATARLLAGDGSHLDLSPTIADGAIPLVTGFTKPSVVLEFGMGYAVELDGLVDFAGLRGRAGAPLRVASFETPPLVPPDGFESATGASVGGGTIVTVAPFAPLAGAKSVYFGAPGAPAANGITPGTSFRVRLAVPVGATKLVYAARTVSRSMFGGATGAVTIGSVGQASSVTASAVSPTSFMPLTLSDGTQLNLSDVVTQTVALPADVGAELLVAFETTSPFCGPGLPPGGVILDDLRLE